MKRLWLWLLAAVVVVAMSVTLWRYLAADRGQVELVVVEIRGAVMVTPGGAPSQAATEGQAIGVDDAIATPEGGRAVLALNGNTRIALGSSSRVRVDKVGAEGVRLELEDGALEATVRPESGAVRVANRGRAVVATQGSFAVGVAGDVFQVDAREGDVVLSGVDVTRLEEGQQATVIDRHAEIAPVPDALLLDVAWPTLARTREEEGELAGTTVPGALVLVTGRFGERRTRADATGAFRLSVPLQEGDNEVTVRCTDPLGRTRERAGALGRRDTTGPRFQGGVEYGP
jgi:hypothetical protein